MEGNEKFKRTFERFEKAFVRFKVIIEPEYLFDFLSEDLIIEVATKRFEYTFESMWKSVKEYFRKEGLDCPTPLRCFKEAFKAKLIKDEDIFLEMIERRNQMVHIYDLDQVKDIYGFIKTEKVFLAIKDVYEKLRKEAM